jgi:hypothetical protein
MLDYAGEFEVHVTVRPSSGAALERFRAWCLSHDCKCVRIVLARGEHVEQPMATWRRGATTLPAVVEETRHMIGELERVAVPVVRVKVEAAPTNEGVPQNDAEATGQDEVNYFEHHVKLLREPAADREALLLACVEFGAHLSRNAWREYAHGLEERFVTMRSYRVGRVTAEQRLQRLLVVLTDVGEKVLEVESEYNVYDSNVQLDAGWLPRATLT